MKRQLPDSIEIIIQIFVDEIARILSSRLYGIYMYGATVFPDAGPIMDIDCHVVLNEPLREDDRRAIIEVLQDLDEKYPHVGGSPDAYFVLLDEAKTTSSPQHQLDMTMFDTSWALHCAHVRAGRYETLWGPEPTEIFPPPSWVDIEADLMGQLDYIEKHLCYPAYCVLNLCRIMYSYSARDVVVSKQFSGNWGAKRFPEWKPLIQAAMKYNAEMRYYTKMTCREDDSLLEGQLRDFLAFSVDYINIIRKRNTE